MPSGFGWTTGSWKPRPSSVVASCQQDLESVEVVVFTVTTAITKLLSLQGSGKRAHRNRLQNNSRCLKMTTSTTFRSATAYSRDRLGLLGSTVFKFGGQVPIRHRIITRQSNDFVCMHCTDSIPKTPKPSTCNTLVRQSPGRRRHGWQAHGRVWRIRRVGTLRRLHIAGVFGGPHWNLRGQYTYILGYMCLYNYIYMVMYTVHGTPVAL